MLIFDSLIEVRDGLSANLKIPARKFRIADKPDNSTQARFEYAVLNFHAVSLGKGLAREPQC